ncbi:MAG TPA: BadF/BadG/BcrA/BcrD ATPase family protein [Gemmatimonadaceae bacterium]|nr:BadF/BadG/BcrA/BcrD ATPase family protein [Gemmatimonadaceae bacterium]
MTEIVVGVDAGGSHSEAHVADVRGKVAATARGAPGAMRPGEADRAADAIVDTVRDALAAADLGSALPSVLCVGAAGVGRDAERLQLWEALSARGVADDVVVVTDADTAYDDAFGEGAGILLIAGTGSMAVGRGPTGAKGRCGGWGPQCGDEGSGAWLGRRALSAVTASADGREGPTALLGGILTACEANEAEQLIAWAAAATPADFAALAPVVARAAEGGDARADALLALATEELVVHVRTLARTLFGDERAACPVALAGGLVAPGRPLRKRLERRLKSAVPGIQLHAADVAAVRGAVKMAVRHLGVRG